jgi:hypothetical protein
MDEDRQEGKDPERNLHPKGTEEQGVRKDMSYSPASETETERKQEDPIPEALDDDIDTDKIRVAPGTGGPDDVGDVEVDPEDLNLSGH